MTFRFIPTAVASSTVLFCLALLPMVMSADRMPVARVGDVESGGMGNPQSVAAAYGRGQSRNRVAEATTQIVVGLGWAKGLSREPTLAVGTLRFDPANQSVVVNVGGLESPKECHVWLVDNLPGPGKSVLPEPGDTLIDLGALAASDDGATLSKDLKGLLPAGFELDLVVVSRGTGEPIGGGVLFGAPTLFQRWDMRSSQDARSRTPAPAEAARVQAAPVQAGGPVNVAELVARGEDLFFNETFGGNGRTCGTCHPAENNLTIDPAFIAKLPPTDPLFVAEFLPALAKNFENPLLMRELGLILENVDGMEDLENKFTMRGVPHTLAMPTSLEPNSIDGTTIPPVQRTGWSGDGSPGEGSLRLFAVGAVTQHFTRTLARTPGTDFRLPTDEELDAMEAFQLSLGRQEDPDLEQIDFQSPIVAQGKELFLGDAKCNQCHANAGANAAFAPGNLNFNTGVETLEDLPAKLLDPTRVPPDGGFGRAPNPAGGFGDGTFNTPSLIEAADTGPFFHNNAVRTLESAVEFYDSEAFNNSPAGIASGGIELGTTEVEAISALLRVLNTLENIRSARDFSQRAADVCDRFSSAPACKCRPVYVRARFTRRWVLTQKCVAACPHPISADALKLLKVAIADTQDGVEVLRCGGLHADADGRLEIAAQEIQAAITACSPAERKKLINQAIGNLDEAHGKLVKE